MLYYYVQLLLLSLLLGTYVDNVCQPTTELNKNLQFLLFLV
jgi:hypothetical protein